MGLIPQYSGIKCIIEELCGITLINVPSLTTKLRQGLYGIEIFTGRKSKPKLRRFNTTKPRNTSVSISQKPNQHFAVCVPVSWDYNKIFECLHNNCLFNVLGTFTICREGIQVRLRSCWHVYSDTPS